MPLNSDEQIKAGELRQIVDVDEPSNTKNPSSATVNAPWLVYAVALPAGIESIQGKEVFSKADSFISQATHLVTMRYYPGIVASMRLNYKTDLQRAHGPTIPGEVVLVEGSLYEILFVNNVNNRNRKLILTCLERVRSHGV